MNEEITSFASNPMANALLDSLPKDVASSFSMWGIIWGLLFGAIGFVAFSYGKSSAKFLPMGIGITLMIYPYFIRSTFWVVMIGLGLSAVLFILRD